MTNLFDKKDIFTWANAKKAKEFIGKKCYFADDFDELDSEIKKNITYNLADVNVSSIWSFKTNIVGSYAICLLADKVIKEIKVNYRYRPFRTVAEVDELLAKDSVRHYCFVGSDLYLRYKVQPNITKHILITNLEVDTNTNELRFINGLTTNHWAKNFDIKIAGCWLPFGVEVKEND